IARRASEDALPSWAARCTTVSTPSKAGRMASRFAMSARWHGTPSTALRLRAESSKRSPISFRRARPMSPLKPVTRTRAFAIALGHSEGGLAPLPNLPPGFGCAGKARARIGTFERQAVGQGRHAHFLRQAASLSCSRMPGARGGAGGGGGGGGGPARAPPPPPPAAPAAAPRTRGRAPPRAGAPPRAAAPSAPIARTTITEG